MEVLEAILRVLESPAIMEIILIVISWIGGNKWLQSNKLKQIEKNASKIYNVVNAIVKNSDGKLQKAEVYLQHMDKIMQSYGHAKMSREEQVYAQTLAQDIHDQQKNNKMQYVNDIARIAYLSVSEYERKNEVKGDKTQMFLSIINTFLEAKNFTPLNTSQEEAAKNIAKQIHFEKQAEIAATAED